MSSNNQEYTSSVAKHMLTNKKVRGSILSLAEHSFCGSARIYTSFYREITRENTSSKHERYTTNVANRISNLTQVSYTCFRSFELVFCTLITRDIVYWVGMDIKIFLFYIELSIMTTMQVSYFESEFIPEVSWRFLWRLISQTSAISTLSLLLTGSRGEYLRVVGIIV